MIALRGAMPQQRCNSYCFISVIAIVVKVKALSILRVDDSVSDDVCVSGDSLGEHKGMAFSTRDRDNDRWSDSCAQTRKGGWWYKRCHYANLNGLYLGGAFTGVSKGIVWFHWHGSTYSLKNVVMKIRPQ